MKRAVQLLRAAAHSMKSENISHTNVSGDKLLLPTQLQLPVEMTPRNSPMVWFLIGVLLLSVVINLVILYYVTSLPRRKLKSPATVLVAHLSCVAILFAAVGVSVLGEMISLWKLSGHGMCEATRFFKFTILGVFSLNIIAIIYERLRLFNCFNWGKLLLCRLIFLIWITSIVVSIPTIFMVKYQENLLNANNRTDDLKKGMRKGMCKSVPLLGIFGATVVYELLRFLVFHVSVVGYMAYAMYKIRANLAQLYFLKPIPNAKTRQKVKTIRFIFIHFAIFILVWLPIGALTFTYRVMTRKQSGSRNSVVVTILGLLMFLYLVLNPLIYLCLDVGCCFCIKSKRRRQGIHLPNEKLDGETVTDCQNNLQIGSAQVNKLKGNVSVENGMEMRCTASESDTRNGMLIRNKCSGVVKVNNQQRQISCESVAELHSLDVSRVSTYAVSPTCSINNEWL